MNKGSREPEYLLKAECVGEYEWPHSLSASTSDRRAANFGVSSVLYWFVRNMEFS